MPCRIAKAHFPDPAMLEAAGKKSIEINLPVGCIFADGIGGLDIAEIDVDSSPLHALAYSSSAGPKVLPRVFPLNIHHITQSFPSWLGFH